MTDHEQQIAALESAMIDAMRREVALRVALVGKDQEITALLAAAKLLAAAEERDAVDEEDLATRQAEANLALLKAMQDARHIATET